MHKNKEWIMVLRLGCGIGIISLVYFHVWAAYWFNKAAGDVDSSATSQMLGVLPGLLPALVLLFMPKFSKAYFVSLLSITLGLSLISFMNLSSSDGGWTSVIALFIQAPIIWLFGLVGLAMILGRLNA